MTDVFSTNAEIMQGKETRHGGAWTADKLAAGLLQSPDLKSHGAQASWLGHRVSTCPSPCCALLEEPAGYWTQVRTGCLPGPCFTFDTRLSPQAPTAPSRT